MNDIKRGCIYFDTLNNHTVRVSRVGTESLDVYFHDDAPYEVADAHLRAPSAEELESHLAAPVEA